DLEPPDPRRSGRWPRMAEAVRLAAEAAGEEFLVIANFDQSPFSLACQLRGINEFMHDLLERPDFAHRLLAFCVEPVAAYAIALAEAGAGALNTGDSAAGGSLVGRDIYREFALPYETQVFERIRARVSVPLSL